MKGNTSKTSKCPVKYTLSIMGGKWKWAILWYIYKDDVIRYSKLKNQLKSIADKTLSQQLKELEENQIIHREQYNQIPPRVEYSLTENGKTLIPIIELMAKWGKNYID